ncbi:MAG: hypothetical protein M3P49_11065 [Actinomycetota bacterium]|nr:hypothetical protein [Actinomycetota bacterium]
MTTTPTEWAEKDRREAAAKTRLCRILARGARVDEGSDEARLLDRGRRWAEAEARLIEEDEREHPGEGLRRRWFADDLCLVRDILGQSSGDEERAGFLVMITGRIRREREREAGVAASYRVGAGTIAAYLRGELTDGAGNLDPELVVRKYVALRDAEHVVVDDFMACDHMRDLDLVDDEEAFKIEGIIFS